MSGVQSSDFTVRAGPAPILRAWLQQDPLRVGREGEDACVQAGLHPPTQGRIKGGAAGGATCLLSPQPLCLQGEPGPPGQMGPEGPGGQQGSPGTQGRTIQGPVVGAASPRPVPPLPPLAFLPSPSSPSRVRQGSKERRGTMDTPACRSDHTGDARAVCLGQSLLLWVGPQPQPGRSPLFYFRATPASRAPPGRLEFRDRRWERSLAGGS